MQLGILNSFSHLRFSFISKLMLLFYCSLPLMARGDAKPENKPRFENSARQSFNTEIREVADLLKKVPLEERTWVIDYLKKSWCLYDEPLVLVDKLKIKYFFQNNNLDVILVEPVLNDGLTGKEAEKFRRKIRNLASPTGAPKPDLEGVVYGFAAIFYELEKESGDGFAGVAINRLSNIAEFLIDTTNSVKATEDAVTKHHILEGRRNIRLSEKIGKYDSTEERSRFYDGKQAIVNKFARRLREIGFGNLSIDLDANLNSSDAEIQLTLFKGVFFGFRGDVSIFFNRDELSEFKYETGSFYMSQLTQLGD